LATGSALTFDGTTFSTTTNAALAKIAGAVGWVSVGDNNTGAGALRLFGGSSQKGWQIGSNISTANALEFGLATANGGTTFTNQMILTGSGYLGIGTTSPPQLLSVQGSSNPAINVRNTSSTIDANFYVTSTETTIGTSNGYPFTFVTNNTERMRIDSSGNLLVGTTSGVGSGSKLGVSATSIDALHIIANSSGNNNIVAYNSSGINCFIVANNGNTTNTNNSYGGISDVKLKENITDATPKLAQLNQVRVVNYNLKSSPEHKQLGVIAQELEQIFPAMVEETTDKDMEGNDLGTTTKSVKYSVFVPMLIKSIQEQQTIIQSLTERIIALESKGA
jgi:hypothetical protein